MNTTALIPIHRTNGNREWLQQAVNSLAPQAKILVLENDGEVGEALNAGLAAADTEFVIAFGADDIAAPEMVGWLEGAAWDADVVYPNMILASEDMTDFSLGVYGADSFCGNRLLTGNYVSGASLYRREKALEVGGYRELAGLEDWDLWVRMYRAGARFKPCPEAEMFYRQVAGSRNKTTSVTDIPALFKEITGTVAPVKATFYNQATPATTYLRCQLPARFLPGIVRSELTAVLTPTDVEFPDHQGAAVFQFAGDKTRALNARLMRERGIRVLIEADDNYVGVPSRDVRKRQGWELRIGETPHTRDGHRSIVAHADGVIVTTRYLASQYRKVNPNVYVCRNSVDTSDWPVPKKFDDGTTRVGWVASESHTPDIPLVSKPLEWAAGQNGVEVHTVGMNPRWRFSVHHGWEHDLGAYRTRFQAFDIGVAPVKPTPHSLGRSDLKALEMAMGLCAPILSDVACYEEWTDGENCLKATDAKGFRKALQHLIQNPGEAKQLAAAAREYVLRERKIEDEVHAWEEAIA